MSVVVNSSYVLNVSVGSYLVYIAFSSMENGSQLYHTENLRSNNPPAQGETSK